MPAERGSGQDPFPFFVGPRRTVACVLCVRLANKMMHLEVMAGDSLRMASGHDLDAWTRHCSVFAMVYPSTIPEGGPAAWTKMICSWEVVE